MSSPATQAGWPRTQGISRVEVFEKFGEPQTALAVALDLASGEE